MSAAHPSFSARAADPNGRPGSNYNIAIGYLRAFVVLLVVAHHAALSYHPYAPPPPASLTAQPQLWQAFPVVDPQRWSGAMLLTGFNDVFFMSLLFFLSGLFVWSALEQKGSGSFLRGRSIRLGVPFIVAAAVLAPIAYYPSFLQTRGHGGLADFAHQWLSLGIWPAGPAWFIWVLLAFDIIAATLFAAAPSWGSKLGRFLGEASERPLRFFCGLVLVSTIVYVPLALWLSPMYWSAFGPFAFQTSRILHYFAYFVLGIGLGAYGLDRGLFAPGGRVARRWLLWVLRAIGAFVAAGAVTLIAITSYPNSLGWSAAYDALFSLSCAASCFAFIAVFVRFAKSRSRIFDSLSRTSYGIYLVHYAFVSWLQYAMVPASLPGFVKFAIVWSGAVALSWLTIVSLRRIPAVARVV